MTLDTAAAIRRWSEDPDVLAAIAAAHEVSDGTLAGTEAALAIVGPWMKRIPLSEQPGNLITVSGALGQLRQDLLFQLEKEEELVVPFPEPEL